MTFGYVAACDDEWDDALPCRARTTVLPALTAFTDGVSALLRARGQGWSVEQDDEGTVRARCPSHVRKLGVL